MSTGARKLTPASSPLPDPQVIDAGRVLNDARANIHPGMNRKQRRAAERKAGVFKYPGLHRHVAYDLLSSKTERKGGGDDTTRGNTTPARS